MCESPRIAYFAESSGVVTGLLGNGTGGSGNAGVGYRSFCFAKRAVANRQYIWLMWAERELGCAAAKLPLSLSRIKREKGVWWMPRR